MKNLFTDNDDGVKVIGENGKWVMWNNEDDRGKTSVLFEKGDIWVIPTNEGYFKIVLRLGKLVKDRTILGGLRIEGKTVREVRIFENAYDGENWEEKMWIDIEKEVDRILTALGY
jgi:hypothetical protein